MRRLLIALLALAGCDAPTAAPPPIVLDGSLPPRAIEASCRLEGQPVGVLPELAISEIEVEGVTLGVPVAMVPAPDGSGAVIVLEEIGRLLRLSEPEESTAGVVLLEGGLGARALGLATSAQHPDHLFVASETPSGGVRLSRLDHSAGAIDPASRRVVLESASAHGLAITFDDEGLLYVALGDSAATPESSVDAANPATAEGSVMRIDVSSLDAMGTFSVPADNPTGKQLGLSEPTPVSTWATGLRAPRACAFGDGVAWCLDQGIAVGEVHHVGRARDLGWPTFDGISCLEQECDLELDRMPQAIVPSDEGCGLNGSQIYAGSRFPSLGGMLFYGDGCGEALHGMLLTSPDGHRQSGPLLPIAGLRGLGRDAAGEVYALTPGRILRVEAKNEGIAFPERLSESGCFDAQGRPSPGLVPFEVNAPLWSDGSVKARWLEVPPSKRVDFEEDGTLRFPTGSVIIKTFSYPLGGPDPSPVETRVMVRRQHGWEFHSYRWDGADAVLLADDSSREMNLADGSFLRHDFPDRYSCRVCHGVTDSRVLGPRVDQLNRVVKYDSGHAQQLDAMSAIGLFENAVDAASAPRMAAYGDASLPVERRARAYLHTNCAHCHRPGGWVPDGLDVDMRHEADFAQMGLCGEPTQSGSAGIRLVPGDPDASRLVERISVRDFWQMPPLGTTRVDDVGVGVVRAWIAAMSSCPGE